ncbi:MAG: FAD-dependent oxidoreductase [Pyrinomonadaceae bacterium]
MANILILGGGFGGLVTAERLSALLGESHQITLVAPNQNFTFYPALVDLAFGRCDAADITFDLGAKLEDLGIRFVHGEVLRINPSSSTVDVTGDDFKGEIAYDYLVIATGRRLATEHVPGFFEFAQHLLGIGAATRFGEKIRDFREGTIVVGTCPDGRLPVPVCETAFALAHKFRAEVASGSVRIKVVFPESLEAAFGGATLHKELEAAFERNRISVHYEIPITEINENELVSSGGHKIDYDLLMLIPPFRGQAMLHHLGITDEHDFVKVDGMMRVHDLPNAYAVGDIVAFSGPKFAHMAVRQADVVAANLAATIRGIEPSTEYYHEIAAIIDAGGPDSIYLHYGIWDDTMYNVNKGHFWGWAKEMHDKLWLTQHN